MTKLLQLPEVVALTSLPRNTIFAQVRNGSFPAPIRISARRRAWRSDELDSWIEARTKASRPELAAPNRGSPCAR